MNKEDNNEKLEKTEKFSGIILPWLNYIYKLLILPNLNKRNLHVDEEFWFFLSLGILTSVLYFKGVSGWWPITFFCGAFVVFCFYNSNYLRRTFLPRQQDVIKEFFLGIEQKALEEVLDFIKYYNLEKNNIHLLLKSKFRKNFIIYKFINKYQRVDAEILEILIKNKLIQYVGKDLFCKYIDNSVTPLDLQFYSKLKKDYKNNKLIQKSLSVNYPQYIKSKSLFYLLASFRLQVKNWFVFSSAKGKLFILSTIIALYSVYSNPPVLQMERTNSILAIFNTFLSKILGLLIVITLLWAIFCYSIVGFFKFYKFILYLIAPTDIDEDLRKKNRK